MVNQKHLQATVLNVPLRENTRQTSAYDNNISCQLGDKMPTCRTGHNSHPTQLLHVRSQIDRQLRLRSTILTQSDYNNVERRHSNTSPSTNEQIPNQLLRSSQLTHEPTVRSTHAEVVNFVSTAAISSYSLASISRYTEISINSYDLGYFKLVHPTTVQVFIRLHKYA